MAKLECLGKASVHTSPSLQLLSGRFVLHPLASQLSVLRLHSNICASKRWRKEKKRKDYAFRHQFYEKPSIIPGCPGSGGDILYSMPPKHMSKACVLKALYHQHMHKCMQTHLSVLHKLQVCQAKMDMTLLAPLEIKKNAPC